MQRTTTTNRKKRARRARPTSALKLILLTAMLITLICGASTRAQAQAQDPLCVQCLDDPVTKLPQQKSVTRRLPASPKESAAADGQPTTPLADSLAKITISSKKFLEELYRSLVDTFRDPITWLAAVFGAILIAITMTQLPWQSDSAIKLLLGILRITVFCGLFFMIPQLFAKFDTLVNTDGSTTIDDYGEALDSQGRIVLNIKDKVFDARLKFDAKYEEFTNNYFKDAQPEGTTEESVGKLWDISKPWYENVDRVLSPNDWDPARMFSFMTIARGLFALTELCIGMLWAFVKLAFFLMAPVALAAGINKQTANRITYPYVHGLIVFYCIWPPVADVIRLASYKACTMTLEAFMRPAETIRINELGNMERVIHAGTIDAYGVMAGCGIMLVCTLMQFGSPFLAYKFWNGQIFEAVTQQTSSWIASVTGTIAEVYGAKMAADIDNAARALEIRGNYESTIVRADHQRDASYLGYQASRRMAEASAESQRISGEAGANSYLRSGLMTNDANRNLNVNIATTQTGAAVAQNEIGRAQQLGNTLTNRTQRVNELENRKNYGMADIGVSSGANAIKEGGGALAGPVAGGLIRGGTSLAEGGARAGIINKQYKGLQGIQEQASNSMSSITNQTADATRDNLRTSLNGGMTITGETVKGQVPAWNEYKQETDAATQAGYEIQMGGVHQAYQETMAGIHDAYGLNTQAADTVYSGDLKAAGIMRDASTEAASMHKVATIIQNVSRDFDRKLEQAITIRL